jgi:DNA-binding MarR family transcriptional regulator
MERILLDELERALTAGLRADARRSGVTESTARILLAVDDEEALPMAMLADRLGRSPSTITRFADRAAREGLLVRVAGPDRRQRLASLTPAGRVARARLQEARRARSRALPPSVQATTGLGAGEVEWFLAALVDAVQGAQEGGAAGGPAGSPRPGPAGS